MKSYYKIKEISKLYKIGPDSLRYYEELGILHPTRDKNNYRQYTTNDIHRLNVIKDLRNLGFSMQTIKAYLENRSIQVSMDVMQQEEQILLDKMKELEAIHQRILHRKAMLAMCAHFSFEQIEVVHMEARKCVTLHADRMDEFDYLLIKLSKEHEKNVFTIGNFNTGCFLNIDKQGCIHPQSVFILGDTLDTYDSYLPSGAYLNLYYQGEKDDHYEHVHQMLAYCEQHHYEIELPLLELFIIDVHETKDPKEYITQLQLKIKQKS